MGFLKKELTSFSTYWPLHKSNTSKFMLLLEKTKSVLRRSLFETKVMKMKHMYIHLLNSNWSSLKNPDLECLNANFLRLSAYCVYICNRLGMFVFYHAIIEILLSPDWSHVDRYVFWNMIGWKFLIPVSYSNSVWVKRYVVIDIRRISYASAPWVVHTNSY